jgi:hypothetical protein
MRFPGGKLKALTLSYDDGVKQDQRLIDILNTHGIKATFNINSGLFADTPGDRGNRMTRQEALETYANTPHEVAIHALTHPPLDKLPIPAMVMEVMEDRKNLEAMFGTIIRGMAYPQGTYNDAVVEALKSTGVVYSRTCISTHDFRLPTDWLRLTATCHHKDDRLFELADQFLTETPLDLRINREPWLFYLWGHSYEFDHNSERNNWNRIEQFAEKMGGHEDIWYATNIEIYDYVMALRALEFSADRSMVYNPTATDVWVRYNHESIKIPAGKLIRLEGN